MLNSITEIFKLIDNIKKLITVTLFISFCVLIGAAWENRIELVKYLVKHIGDIEINHAVLDTEAITLLHDINAETLSIWSADPQRNQRVLLYRRTSKGVDIISNRKSDVLFRSNLQAAVVELINSRAICNNVTQNNNSLTNENIVYTCAVSMPPDYSQGFIGLLVVGFTQKPLHEDYIILRMKQASLAMTN